mgnify:FL=1
MKKILSAVMAGAVALSLTACGGNSASSASTASSAASAAASEPAAALQTVNPGKLTVATSPDFAPYEFYYIDENGDAQLSGFDVALAGVIADKLGLELEVIPMDFDGILMELQSGNVDIGMAGFSPDPERAETFDFSDIYYLGGQSFCVTKDNLDKYKDYSDFDGKSVGAQTGSIQMKLANENTPNANIVGLSKVTDVINELISGKLDGAFIETAVAECYAKNYPELALAWDVPYEAEGSAVALKKGNDALLAAVNSVIAEVKEDGTMDQLVADANELASDSDNVYEGMLEDDAASEAASTSEAASASSAA